MPCLGLLSAHESPGTHPSFSGRAAQKPHPGAPEAGLWKEPPRSVGRLAQSGAPRLAWIVPNAVPAQPADTRQSPHASPGGSLSHRGGHACAPGNGPSVTPLGAMHTYWAVAMGRHHADASHVLCRFFLLTLWRSRGDCSHYTTKVATEVK